MRAGRQPQTRRHAYLVSLVGIKQVVLAVNKLDLVGYQQEVFDAIVADFRTVAQPLGFTGIHAHSAVGTQGGLSPAAGTLVSGAYRNQLRNASFTQQILRKSCIPGAVGEPAKCQLPRIQRHPGSRSIEG